MSSAIGVPSGRKARLEADRRLRAVAVVADVLLARPDSFTGLPTALRDRDRLGDLVGPQRRPKPPPEKRVVDEDVLGLHAGGLRRELSAPRSAFCVPTQTSTPVRPAHARWR